MYAILDTVVQAVLTDQNADIDALLADADRARSRRSSTPTDPLPLDGGRPFLPRGRPP